MVEKIISKNPSAYRDYNILEAVEAGIELKGSEVKSIRLGRVNLKDSFARIEDEEVYLFNCHISPYEQASYLNVDPVRKRKLLLHKAQIRRLLGQTAQKGLTLVPTKLYFNRGFVKLELALAKGKRLYDKRRAIKKREEELIVRRALKTRRRS